MAIPAFVKAGTGAIWASGAAVSCSVATTTAGNLIMLHIVVDGTYPEAVTLGSITNLENLAGTTGAMTGFITDLTANTTTSGLGSAGLNGGQYIYIGRSTAGGTCSLTVVGGVSGADCYFRLYEFSGVNSGATLGSILETGAGTGAADWANTLGTSTSIAQTVMITTGADELALNLVGINDDATGIAAFTGTSGGTWLMPASFESATGTDATVSLMTADMAAAGTISGGSATITSDAWGVVGFSLKPPAVVAGVARPERVYYQQAVNTAGLW